MRREFRAPGGPPEEAPISSAIPTPPAAQSGTDLQVERDERGRTVLRLTGRLDADSTGPIWRNATRVATGGDLVLDASGVEYCDGAGANLILALRQQQARSGGTFSVEGLREEFGQLVELIQPSEEEHPSEAPPRESFIVGIGRSTFQLLAEVRRLVVFTGELTLALLHALRRPLSVRWKDVLLVAERAGNGAVPIIVLIGFLLGLILAFQSAIPMRRFGAEIFVADLLGISVLRELGPLMAAIMLTARSGSAFAAELGTMKVNEEVDALTTMGLEPVGFLIVPRVLAALIVVPVLIMLMNFSSLIGGAVVMLSLEFPLVTYVNRIVEAVTLVDFLGGLFKGFVFGMVVAAVGCLRGLQTGSGAGAVGESTTSAVVSGIILVAVADGIFAVIFYIVGL
jgi:phospholipid/cholesterol/gamma-HCH transport system permease protein